VQRMYTFVSDVMYSAPEWERGLNSSLFSGAKVCGVCQRPSNRRAQRGRGTIEAKKKALRSFVFGWWVSRSLEGAVGFAMCGFVWGGHRCTCCWTYFWY
jgi:hypothetical protein